MLTPPQPTSPAPLALTLALTLALGLTTARSASAKPKEEAFPVIGSVSTGVAFNHSNFVGSEQSAAAANYGAGESSGFGWSRMNINFGASYLWAFSKKLPPIFFSGGISMNRALSESNSRAGVPTTQPKEINISDMSLSAGWGVPGVGKLLKGLMANVSLNGSVPFSRASRSAGIISATSGTLSVIYASPIKLIVQTFASFGYNFLSNPTIEVDCELMPQYCEVSGADLGSPNSLSSWATGLGVMYPLPINGLRVSGGYSIFGGFGAVSFADTGADPYASPYGQSGTQWSVPFHRMGFSLMYGFNNTGSAAQQAINDSVKGQLKEEESELLKRLSVRAGMSTGQRLYSMDNSRVTFPLFDFETNTKSRTSYNFTLQLAF